MRNESLIRLYYRAASDDSSAKKYWEKSEANLKKACARLPERLFEMINQQAFHDWLMTEFSLTGGTGLKTMEASIDVKLQKFDRKCIVRFEDVLTFQAKGKVVNAKIPVSVNTEGSDPPFAEVMDIWFSAKGKWIECYILFPEKRYMRIACKKVLYEE